MLDPNHARTQAESPEGVVLVPLSVDGPKTTIHQNAGTPDVIRGRRSSPRELLHEVKAAHPDRLTIWTDTLVTKVLFAPGETPRAIGVEYQQVPRLYRATKRRHGEPAPGLGTAKRVFVEAQGEVVLCGGAFNTPQLLMLSGHRRSSRTSSPSRVAIAACALCGEDGTPLPAAGSPRRIHLPGIGKNLQDRYEVSLVSQMPKDFSLLDGATFDLPQGQTVDRHLQEWRAEGTGLYTSNGAVLGIFKRSNPDLDQPDLFIFGLPFDFRGYELGYSEIKNHTSFTWAILKGHTRNGDGTVRLRSTDPRDTPLINFHYFNETSQPGKGDARSRRRGPGRRRAVRARHHRAGPGTLTGGTKEIHPTIAAVPDDDASINAWIRREAWGHHACGTCRMGPDHDPEAVLDSRFRVRGVAGLRVVDASVFPRIPGYFIVANVYMASEKAADVLHEDRQNGRPDDPWYPRDLRRLEAAAVRQRRRHALPQSVGPVAAAQDADLATVPDTDLEWRSDVTGLALSGGGVRSATVALGLLQALARQGRLRCVDFLSTVSGGGYTGAFLGRWFARYCSDLGLGRTRRAQAVDAGPDRARAHRSDVADRRLAPTTGQLPRADRRRRRASQLGRVPARPGERALRRRLLRLPAVRARQPVPLRPAQPRIRAALAARRWTRPTCRSGTSSRPRSASSTVPGSSSSSCCCW